MALTVNAPTCPSFHATVSTVLRCWSVGQVQHSTSCTFGRNPPCERWWCARVHTRTRVWSMSVVSRYTHVRARGVECGAINTEERRSKGRHWGTMKGDSRVCIRWCACTRARAPVTHGFMNGNLSSSSPRTRWMVHRKRLVTPCFRYTKLRRAGGGKNERATVTSSVGNFAFAAWTTAFPRLRGSARLLSICIVSGNRLTFWVTLIVGIMASDEYKLHTTLSTHYVWHLLW